MAERNPTCDHPGHTKDEGRQGLVFGMHGAHDRKCNESRRAVRQLRPLQAPFGRFSGAVMTIYVWLSSSDVEMYRVESPHHAVFSVSSLNHDTADHWTILYAAGLGAGLTEAVLAVTPTETIKSGNHQNLVLDALTDSGLQNKTHR